MANIITKNGDTEFQEFVVHSLTKIDQGLDQMSSELNKKADKADLESKADKSDIERVLARVSMIGGNVDDYRAEQAVTQRQVARHEKWHRQIAQKIGIKLAE